MTHTPPPVEEKLAEFCSRCHQGPETHRTIENHRVLCDDGFPSDSLVPHIFDGDDDAEDSYDTRST